MWLFRLKLENTEFINSRSLINKKKKKKKKWPRTRLTKICEIIFRLSLWKKKSSKIIRLSAFACHCSRVTLDSKGGCERASSSMRRGKIQLDWFPTLRMLVKCTRLNVTTNRQKSNHSDRTYSHSGRVFFSSNLHVEQCDFWTRSRQPREKYRWTKRFGIYSIFYLKVSEESEYIEFQRW